MFGISTALAVVSLLELVLWVPLVWKLRKALAPMLSVAIVVCSLWLVVLAPLAWTALILFASLYRVFNLWRVTQGRVHEQYLWHTTQRTALILIIFQLVVSALWTLSTWLIISLSDWFVITTFIALAGVLVLAASTRRHLRTTQVQSFDLTYTDKELPTLTVAIPARNETEDLEDCLRSLIKNDYPKLEILVLDDSSNNKRTPEIIRSFAHDGVRFVQGEEPSNTWLAKNQAYQKLYEEANGELILFCGVDTRFEPRSLRAIVTTLLKKHKTMMSIMPKNIVPSYTLASLLTQPMRYAWELALPRRMFNRPPVLSTCWITYRQEIAGAGSFAAVSRKIVPESYFVYGAIAADGYSFVQSSDDMPLESRKSTIDQYDTAVRTRYPQLHRRPEWVCLLTVLELGLIVTPLTNIIVALTQQYAWWLAVVNAISLALLLYFYAQIVHVTYRTHLWFSYGVLPLALLYDVYLLHVSMWKYEFSEVIWKGRDARIPVMHVFSHLPPE